MKLKIERIGYDNSGKMPGWHLDSVRIEAPFQRKVWFFPCGLWFDLKKDDRQIERELFPADTDKLTKTTKYIIDVNTSDVAYAGTVSDS